MFNVEFWQFDYSFPLLRLFYFTIHSKHYMNAKKEALQRALKMCELQNLPMFVLLALIGPFSGVWSISNRDTVFKYLLLIG